MALAAPKTRDALADALATLIPTVTSEPGTGGIAASTLREALRHFALAPASRSPHHRRAEGPGIEIAEPLVHYCRPLAQMSPEADSAGSAIRTLRGTTPGRSRLHLLDADRSYMAEPRT